MAKWGDSHTNGGQNALPNFFIIVVNGHNVENVTSFGQIRSRRDGQVRNPKFVHSKKAQVALSFCKFFSFPPTKSGSRVGGGGPSSYGCRSFSYVLAVRFGIFDQVSAFGAALAGACKTHTCALLRIPPNKRTPLPLPPRPGTRGTPRECTPQRTPAWHPRPRCTADSPPAPTTPSRCSWSSRRHPNRKWPRCRPGSWPRGARPRWPRWTRNPISEALRCQRPRLQ